jgi:hypothetical protein
VRRAASVFVALVFAGAYWAQADDLVERVTG